MIIFILDRESVLSRIFEVADFLVDFLKNFYMLDSVKKD